MNAAARCIWRARTPPVVHCIQWRGLSRSRSRPHERDGERREGGLLCRERGCQERVTLAVPFLLAAERPPQQQYT